MVRQSLDIRLGQHLTLTPALQQSIRLLQLSSLDLQAEIERALDENPMLEVEAGSQDEAEVQPVIQEVEPAPEPDKHADLYSSTRRSRDDEYAERPESSASPTLREHLLSQLGTTRVSERDAALVSLLIDDLNDDGFLESSLETILAMLDPDTGVDLDELQAALRLLQSFEPSGIGARDLAECLSLQLAQPDAAVLPALREPRVLEAARLICKEHLNALASGNLAKLQELIGCDAQTLQLAHACILRLNPRPGSPWSKPAADYAIPDIIVRKTSEGFRPALNESALPKLNVNSVYAQALGSVRSGEHTALQGQLQEARWLIRNINQRFETILRVSEFIVAHQQSFFERGWGALKPLTLREVAAELGLHESTISRATNQKFMLTPFGTVELKRFFATGLNTGSGEATSSMAVQTKIRNLIDQEDTNKPLSDGQLATLLDKEGIQVARRTVAKYRELMRIPSATLRKSQAQARR
ncbi:MAG: RNA polymerase factor sigma-54 [Burkholderiaceae bacterium]|nr:RNA polymerase factor sigma-54 [Burkholderiaceae bacterium]MCD8518183.1 RNA polymerase factor sigma-54 [Burkholderiaceae bacterium]MCD8536024.1 RNA polymerase factor sigma-54 [Burkholderiaceae bacterium]MCD8564128.1 RNA polymerase factor sigma-54 [Burkholderiaceae bacterium]